MREVVTPHKISILILIRVFGEMKLKLIQNKQGRYESLSAKEQQANLDMTNAKYRKNYCMVMLNLLQGPDIPLADLFNILKSPKTPLFPALTEKFMEYISQIIDKDIDGLLELVCKVNILMSEPTAINPVITRTSVIGLFVRRAVVLFEKLSCSGVVAVFKAFKSYQATAPKVEVPARHLQFDTLVDDDEDMAQITEGTEAEQPTAAQDNWTLWTRRQGELFLAQQSSLILKNEAQALSPERLHARLEDLLDSIPDCTEAYFLKYLNYLRVKDFCGAMHSLYDCFDRGAGFYLDSNKWLIGSGTNEDKARSFRYGALNLAMFYCHFGHKEEALLALKECVMLAHGSSCNFCLQHALGWLYRLSDDNKAVLMERSITRSSELNLHYLSSLGTQAFAQHLAFSKQSPATIFEVVTKSDVMNCNGLMPELCASSYSLKSILWALYGRPVMSGLYAQLLLNSDYQDTNSEATCMAICQLASQIMSEGEPKLAASLLWHAKERFPQLATKRTWTWCEQVMTFDHMCRQELWQDARRAAEQLSAVNPLESMLRMAELTLLQDDREGALNIITDVLKECAKDKEISPNFEVRAIILMARILGINNTVSGHLLVSAMKKAEAKHLNNLTSAIALRIAEHQMELGLPSHGLKLLSKKLLSILSHGSAYEQAEAVLLQIKCQLARNHHSDVPWGTLCYDTIKTLKSAKIKFEQCQAVGKVRECLLLMGILYHSFQMNDDKYNVALELRQLDEQISSSSSSHV